MSEPRTYEAAVDSLRRLLAACRAGDAEWLELHGSRDPVLARYAPMFTPARIPSISVEEFREFLMFRNNRHWSGLQRLGPAITADVEALRSALLELIDESTPVSRRLDSLIPGGKARVRKLGKAVLTPILLITHPSDYGVWNGTSEGALKQLGIWPEFDKGSSLGERYSELNDLLQRLAADVGVDLWTLDALWWRVLRPDEESVDIEEIALVELEATADGICFGLERHLHDFMLDNWEAIDLGRTWDLVEEGGDVKGYGYERPTPVGKIDLLAKHKTEPRWLVIELKRGQTSDTTVGQVLRYMGWVGAELADDGETVEGLIIALQEDEKLKYAMKVADSVGLMLYEVDFRLRYAGD